MKIEFTDDRDLLEFGKASLGDVRDDLPADFAALQVQYGNAVEVAADGGDE